MVRFFINVVTIYLKPFRIKKRILYLLLFCLSGIKAQAQSLTTQVDSIVFSGKVEEREAILCAKYIQKYYHDTSLPLIYLNIRYRDKFKKDTIELANDNLYGDALDNDTYDRNSKYYQPGIRIKLRISQYNPKILLQLLDYGINNLYTLKTERSRVLKLSDYDRPKSPTLSKKKIKIILNKKSNKKISNFLKTINKIQ